MPSQFENNFPPVNNPVNIEFKQKFPKWVKYVLVILLVVVALLVVFYCLKYLKSSPPGMVGNDSDKYGCKQSAGYSWCAIKNKCLQTWKEPCNFSTSTVVDYNAIGWISKIGDDWQFTARRYVTDQDEWIEISPIKIVFTSSSICRSANGQLKCDLSVFAAPSHAHTSDIGIEGIKNTDYIVVKTLTVIQ